MSQENKILYPTISVVIPLFNHEAYIEEALRSVISQTCAADEIILIDDGSTDSGFSLAKKMLKQITNSKCVYQENTGAHIALNNAIGMATGDYIAILNSDDKFTGGKIERCKNLLQKNPECNLVCGSISIIDDSSKNIVDGVTIDWLNRAQKFLKESKLQQLSLLNENFVATTSNMVFSRRLWRLSGGFQNLRYCHDLDFLMFAHLVGNVVIDSEYQHIFYRVHRKNTIKEDLGNIKIEIAAVVADAFYSGGQNVFCHGDVKSDLIYLNRMLENKNISDLIIYFLTLRNTFTSRSMYYDFVAAGITENQFRALLR